MHGHHLSLSLSLLFLKPPATISVMPTAFLIIMLLSIAGRFRALDPLMDNAKLYKKKLKINQGKL
jgi:hypothetical protein